MACSTGIGLDVHARSVAAAAFVLETGEVARDLSRARARVPRRAGHPAEPLCAAGGPATRDPRPAEHPGRSIGMR